MISFIAKIAFFLQVGKKRLTLYKRHLLINKPALGLSLTLNHKPRARHRITHSRTILNTQNNISHVIFNNHILTKNLNIIRRIPNMIISRSKESETPTFSSRFH